MATYSSILALKIPWIEEPGGYSPWGCKELDSTERLRTQVEKPCPAAVLSFTVVLEEMLQSLCPSLSH